MQSMSKERITVTLDDDRLTRIDELVRNDEHDDAPHRSRSEAVRALLDQAFQYDEELMRNGRQYDDLKQAYEDLKTECERHENDKQKLVQARQEHAELVEYVDEERTWRSVPLKKRLKWWVFGMQDS